MEVNYVKLIFSFSLKTHVSDPYLFFGCRSAFDDAFRAAAGCRKGECSGCARSGGCAYAATFSQELSRDPDAVRRHQKPPLPFVFQMPVVPTRSNSLRTLSCSLMLFGSAIQLIEVYLTAVTALMHRLGGEIVLVEVESPGGGRSPLRGNVAAAELPLLSAADPSAAGPLAPDKVRLEFLTPLKILQDGKMLKQITFSHLARALMRRASSLAYYYGGFELPLDFRTLAARSEAVSMTTCEWRVEQWGAKISGITGSAVFSGDLEEFHLLLQLGTAMNIGKGASFGLGQFRVGA